MKCIPSGCTTALHLHAETYGHVPERTMKRQAKPYSQRTPAFEQQQQQQQAAMCSSAQERPAAAAQAAGARISSAQWQRTAAHAAQQHKQQHARRRTQGPKERSLLVQDQEVGAHSFYRLWLSPGSTSCLAGRTVLGVRPCCVRPTWYAQCRIASWWEGKSKVGAWEKASVN